MFFYYFFLLPLSPPILSPAGAAAADGGVGLGEDGGAGGQGVEVRRADHRVTQGPYLGGGSQGWRGWGFGSQDDCEVIYFDETWILEAS